MTKNRKSIKSFIVFLLVLALILPANFSDVLAIAPGYPDLVNNHDTELDEEDFAADLYKRAIALNEDGEFEVSIKVEGKEELGTNEVDVVFVLDHSTSMSKGSVQKANAAIINFQDILVPGDEDATNANIRFGLVTYATGIDKTIALSNTKIKQTDLPSNSSGGNGSTHTQLGLRTGAGLFGSSTRTKIIVLLTDGVPTYSDEVTSIIDSTGDYIPMYGNGFSDGDDYGDNEGAAYDSRVGSGNYYLLKRTGSGSFDHEYTVDGVTIVDNGFATISEARSIKANDIEIFGIAMALTNNSQGISATNSKKVIEDIATPGKFFDVEDLSNLSTVLGSLATTVMGNIVDGRLVDPMSIYADYVVGSHSFITSPSTGAPTFDYNEASRVITLTNIDLGAGQYFILKYKVKLLEKYKDGHFHELNEETRVYQNPNDMEGLEIEVPEGKAYKDGINVVKEGQLTEDGLGIKYRITVTNTGSVDLFGVSIEDELLGLVGEGKYIVGDLEAGKSTFIEMVYTLTEEDLERGFVDNYVEVIGYSEEQVPVWDEDDVRVIIEKEPEEPKNSEFFKEVEGGLHKNLETLEEEFDYTIEVQLPDDLSGYARLEIKDQLDDLLDILEVKRFLNGSPTSIGFLDEDHDTNTVTWVLENLLEFIEDEVEISTPPAIVAVYSTDGPIMILEEDEGSVSGEWVELPGDFEALEGMVLKLVIRARIKSGVELEEILAKYLDNKIPNKAFLRLNEDPAEESNVVTVSPPVPPDDDDVPPPPPPPPPPTFDDDDDDDDTPPPPVVDDDPEDEPEEEIEILVDIPEGLPEEVEEEEPDPVILDEVIDVELELPEGLPQTGEGDHLGLYLLGLVFIALGIFTRRRRLIK